jgi:CRP/FNR family transcriptional regulator, nitrogen oxide reductase regulator
MKPGPSKSVLIPVVRSSPAFRGLPEWCVRSILERATREEYLAQKWLYRQGQPANKFFLLESGLLSLSEVTANGEESLLRFIVPGELTGHVALSDLQENVLSAQAVKTSRVIVWRREVAMQLVKDVPMAAANLLSNMIRDVVHYYHCTRRQRTEPLDRRVRWALSELARAIGKLTPEGMVIEPAGQHQLAQLAGTNIYSISRELTKLQQLRVLRKQRNRIVLLQETKLHG